MNQKWWTLYWQLLTATINPLILTPHQYCSCTLRTVISPPPDSSPKDVVLIPNVTYGMSTVLKSLIDTGYLTAASKIIFMNLTYGEKDTARNLAK